MLNDRPAVLDDRDLLARQIAATEERDRFHRCVVPIVDCIRKMRVEGLADGEIVGLFRHAAEELDQATFTPGNPATSGTSLATKSLQAGR